MAELWEDETANSSVASAPDFFDTASVIAAVNMVSGGRPTKHRLRALGYLLR